MRCARKIFASASSVSLFPRPRIRDITSDRFALVKTSGMERFAVIGGERETPIHFVLLVRVHPVVKPAPLRVTRIKFLVGQFAGIGATPCLGSEAFQRGRPAAVRIVDAVGRQVGKGGMLLASSRVSFNQSEVRSELSRRPNWPAFATQ